MTFVLDFLCRRGCTVRLVNEHSLAPIGILTRCPVCGAALEVSLVRSVESSR